jgi:hypothetical protein
MAEAPPGADEHEIWELDVKFWLNRAISKYRAAYGTGTREMADLLPWAAAPLSVACPVKSGDSARPSGTS